MHGSNRGIIAALIGIALLAGLIAFGLTQQSTYADRANSQSANYAKHAADKIKQTCLSLVRGEQPKCLRDEAQAYRLDTRDKQREYDDLVAQQTSALWTMIMGIAALIGMALSVVGVVLVWTTFRETKASNIISVQANTDTRNHLRAFLRIEGITFTYRRAGRQDMIDPDVQPIKIETTVKNTGASRAVNVEVTADVYWRGGVATGVRGAYTQSDQIAEIRVDKAERFRFEAEAIHLDIAALQRGEYARDELRVVVYVKSEDVFGTPNEITDTFTGKAHQMMFNPEGARMGVDAYSSGVTNGMQRELGPMPAREVEQH